MKKINYDKLKSSINTFDIILFSGRGRFSKVIECCSNSIYSHIGIVVKGDVIRKSFSQHISNFDPDDLYLFHSNKGSIGEVEDVIFETERSGAQINPLRDVLETYIGKIFYRQLIGKRTPHQMEKLGNAFEELHGRGYETNYCEMFCALLPCTFIGRDVDELFCSELVAEVYLQVGIFDKDYGVASDNYIPSDFSEESGSYLPFEPHYELGEEFEIKI